MSTVIDGVDYGPLFPLIGSWRGEKGLNISSEPEGDEKHAYYDEISFKPSGPAENAEEQQLVSLRYRQVVRKRSNGRIFHDQVGHWIYEPATGLVMHSLTIPRAVCLLAGGSVTQEGGEITFDVEAVAGSDSFGVIQSPFMLEKAKTTRFTMKMSVSGDQLSYEEITYLDIYGRSTEHVDGCVLQRVLYDD